MGKTVHSVTVVTKEAALVEAINGVKYLYPDLRQASKAVTFAAQYQGTYRTFMNSSGFSEEDAKALEKSYKELYRVSEAHTLNQVKKACIDGYLSVAFGLRIRTPLLSQVVYGTSSMPNEAAAEARTVGNAISQSYGLLNNRAANDLMKKVWESKHRNDIKPIALVHDAIYLLIKDDVDVVAWVNRELILSMQWQALPEIAHERVKLGANLDICYKGWHQPITIPNHADPSTILAICKAGQEKYDTAR